MGNPEEERPLGRPKNGRWDNIKMHLKSIIWENFKWINLAQNK